MKLLHLVTSIHYIFPLQFVFSVSFTKIKCLCSVGSTAGTRRQLYGYRHFLKQLQSHNWPSWCKSFGSGSFSPVCLSNTKLIYFPIWVNHYMERKGWTLDDNIFLLILYFLLSCVTVVKAWKWHFFIFLKCYGVITTFYNTLLKHFVFSCLCCLFFQLVGWSNGMW